MVTPPEEYDYANRSKRKAAVYKFGYNGKYTDMLYGRLSLLRPDSRVNASVPEKLSKEPVWGLYAIRAWDYQRAKMGLFSDKDAYIYCFQSFERNQRGSGLLDNVGEARKRLLMVVQGLQLTYQPHHQIVVGGDGRSATGNFKTPDEVRYIKPDDTDRYLRAPMGYSQHDDNAKKNYRTYKKNRERIFGLHFWGNARSKSGTKKVAPNVDPDKNPNRHEINEVWLGEGFSQIETVEILGLDRTQFDPTKESDIKKIMEIYSTK